MTKADHPTAPQGDCVMLCKFCKRTTRDWSDPMWCNNPKSGHYLHVLVCGHLVCKHLEVTP